MRTIVISVYLLAACGGSKKAPEPPPVVAEKPAEPAAPPEPAAPAEPAVPKNFTAKAALEPVKGAKMPPGTVSFAQQQGSDTSVTSSFEGLKAGKYHLVIHDGSECGPNATKAGPPWKGGDAVKLTFAVGKDQPGNIEETGVKLMLDGVAPIVGQTLVLHGDKKGQPGKALACGTIEAVGGAE